MSFWNRLSNVFRPSRLDDELSSEVETHLALLEAEELNRGASRAEARRRARERFGNATVYRERTRDRDLYAWLHSFVQDTRSMIRQMVKLPGFTLTVVLMLALGIGVNAAIFTLLNRIVLHSLPVPEPDRLLVMLEELPGGGTSPPSWLDQKDFRDQNRVFDAVGAFSYLGSLVLRSGNNSSHVIGGFVTPDYFATLGVKPIAGRVFDASEAVEGHDNVALVREDYWRSQLGADPDILGTSIDLNGRPCTIIGIMPASFRFPWSGSVVWTPLVPSRVMRESRGWHGFPIIGRLKPGVTASGARADLSAIMERLGREYPDADLDRKAVLVYPLQEWTVGETSNRLRVLQYAALAIFLMTCANVSSLLLARYSSRRREFALRSALGASTLRLIRQHLTESLILAGIGCLFGAAVAWAGVRFLLALYDTSLPRAGEVTVDARLVLFTIGVTLAGAIVFGLTTALHERARDLESALREGGHSAGSRRGAVARQALVALQVACAVTLLAGAAELIRSFQKLVTVDTGLDTSRVVAMRITLPDAQYTDSNRVNHFFQNAVMRIAALPGVKSAASINLLPVAQAGYNGSVEIIGLPPHASNFFAEFRWVAGDYFRTMNIPIVRGRDFTPDELAGRPAVVINQTMARQLWGDRDPIGWEMKFGAARYPVVGISRDVRQSGLGTPPRPEIERPLATQQQPMTEQTIVLRTPLPLDQLAGSIRREIRAVDPAAAIYRVKTMEEEISDSVRYSRIITTLLSLFAGLALLLAAFGLHGVMSYVVTERRREFAIRMAIGARPGQLIRLIGRQSAIMLVTGLAAGLAGAFAVDRLLPGLLTGVQRLDAAPAVLSIVVLLAAAGIGLSIPAWRASRVDPIRTLRQE